ncbi:MAG: SRPBCC family protein [Chloroflexi bacterium]|nr:SRPBCC family protein [Chloroflexota bacterium]MBI5290967.1 SRPBCC family protein [Chloroflexota bacterium]
MIKYRSEIAINRPVDQVFRFVTDVQKYSQWTDMGETRLVSDGPLGVGSKMQTVIKMGPLKVNMTFEVTEYEVNRRMSFIGTSAGPLEWDATFTVEPKDASTTHMTSSGELRLKGLWRLAEPLMAGEVKSGEAKELERLKNLLETTA